MKSRELSRLGLRIAAIWIRVAAIALVPFAVLFLVYWSIRPLFVDEYPDLLNAVYVVGAPIVLFLAAQRLGRSEVWFSREEQGESEETGSQRFVAPLSACLVVYGFWLIGTSAVEFHRGWVSLAANQVAFFAWFEGVTAKQRCASMACEAVLGGMFMVASEPIVRLLLRLIAPRCDAELETANRPPEA